MSTVHNLSTSLSFRRLLKSKEDAFDVFLRSLEETVTRSHGGNYNDLSLIPLLVKGLKKFKKESSNWIPVFSLDYLNDNRFFRVSYRSAVSSIFSNRIRIPLSSSLSVYLRRKPK